VTLKEMKVNVALYALCDDGTLWSWNFGQPEIKAIAQFRIAPYWELWDPIPQGKLK